MTIKFQKRKIVGIGWRCVIVQLKIVGNNGLHAEGGGLLLGHQTALVVIGSRPPVSLLNPLLFTLRTNLSSFSPPENQLI